MTGSRIKPILFCLALMSIVAWGGAANAQAPISLTPVPMETSPANLVVIPSVVSPPVGREASFLPSASPTAAVAPVTLANAPVSLGAPVENAGILKDINPESIGLLSPNDGGLGNALWKNTPRVLVERLLPALELPTASPTLNNLAQRFLLTTASVPDGQTTINQSFTAMRTEELVMLGNAADAWKLVMLAKPEQIDDITLRLVAEAALISSASADVCTKLPDIMKTHTGVEWQKLLFVCQARAGDTKAAQLSVDILHAQNVHDDIFLALAEKNILSGGKQLPRQLTPLKPLTLALLRLIDQPLRDEVYAHPDAALIPELLKTKAVDDKPKLDLAERAAARGLIDAATLGGVYQSVTFPPDVVQAAGLSKETGARLRALLYQATLQEKNPQNKAINAVRFLQSADLTTMGGSVGQLLVTMTSDVSVSADFNASADPLALTQILGGKTDKALAWMKQAQTAAIGMPDVANGLLKSWPLIALSGLEDDKDYAHNMNSWLDAALKPSDVKTGPIPDTRAANKRAASILLLLEANGFAVPDDAWGKVTAAPEFEKRVMPSAFVLERLRAAGTTNRRGEAVLDSLLIANGGNEMPLATALPIIRSLRAVGLTAEAGNLAKEMAEALLLPTAK